MTPARELGNIALFTQRVIAHGGELLAPTNPFEVMRFRTLYGVGVVWQRKSGKQTWSVEAQMAREHIKARKGSLAAVVVKGRGKGAGRVPALLKRDGPDCFFCGKVLADDITVEHLVAIAHGGPNHISNLLLAHTVCNNAAGHLSAPEKVAMAIRERKP